MSTKVTINSIPKYRVSISSQNEAIVRTVGIGGDVSLTGVDRLTQLVDVDATSLNEGETLVYDEDTQLFIVKPLPIIDGGTF